MPKQTRLMGFTFPAPNEEPFQEPFEEGMRQQDVSAYANSENGNLIWSGGGTVSWNSGTGILTWTADINITGMSTGPRFAVLEAGSVSLEDGEVAYFIMPRLLVADVIVELMRSGRIFSTGAKLHDLRLFAVRIGNIVYFGDGSSIQNGESGAIFGSGLGGAGGITLIQQGADGGVVVTNGGGPTVDLEADFAGSGGNFGVATTVARSDHSHAGVVHTHEPQLKIEPGAGVTSLNLNADGGIGAKTLIYAAIFRNGVLQSEGDQVTINLGAQSAALLFTTVASDRFLIERVTT